MEKFLGKEQRHIGLTAKFKMIGNGVPVPLAKQVGLSISNFLKQNLVLKMDN